MPTNVYSRQHSQFAMVELTEDNIGSASKSINIPRDSYVINAGLETVTAFDGTGTVTGTITDGTLVYVNAQDVKSTGTETAAATKKFYPDGGTITFSVADQNSNSATGRAIGFVEYIQLGVEHRVQD